MNASGLVRYKSKSAYYFWIGVFFVGLVGLIGLLYYATLQIDYMWGWYRLPKYFANHETVEINAGIEGRVDEITDNVIRVKGGDGVESHEVPSDGEVRVTQGDWISPGDTLATYKEWQAGLMAQGMWITLKVSLYSIIFGIIIGLIGGVARISSNPALKWWAMTYVELIRGSPLMVQIFIWYFVLATLVNQILAKIIGTKWTLLDFDTGWSLVLWIKKVVLNFFYFSLDTIQQILIYLDVNEIPALYFGVAALACFTGAYVTEIVRAGIQSIHRGQIEAARSLGMTNSQSLIYIILPQAMRRILPPLAGQFISLIKDSSLLGAIAIRELTKATREAITTSLQTYEFWFICAIMYLVLTFALSMFVQYLERRMATS